MFVQLPRSDSAFWKLVQQNKIEDEENLPTSIDELNDDDAANNTKMNPINDMDCINADVISLVHQLSDDIASNRLNNMSSCQTVLNGHDRIRKTGTDNYLATAHKKMKTHQDSIIDSTKKFNVNDCVEVSIHNVDRTNTGAKMFTVLIY